MRSVSVWVAGFRADPCHVVHCAQISCRQSPPAVLGEIPAALGDWVSALVLPSIVAQ